jgi:hypothetical protein
MLTNRSMPATTVIPVLVYEDVPEAIEWLCDAFGFRERERVGDYWAYLAIGDGAMIGTQPMAIIGVAAQALAPTRGHAERRAAPRTTHAIVTGRPRLELEICAREREKSSVRKHQVLLRAQDAR